MSSPTMASSWEEALDRLIEKCQTYRRQCEEYRNKAITGQQLIQYPQCWITWYVSAEFRGQLDSLLFLLVSVVPRVLDGVKVRHMMRWEGEREQLRATHSQTMEEMRRRKVRWMRVTVRVND